MATRAQQLFVPGFGAAAGLYPLPESWIALEPPPFARLEGLESYQRWLGDELGRRPGRITLAGHSLGGALALLAAAEAPERIERLVLVSPAGLPLGKPIHRSARDFLRQLADGLYPRAEAAQAIGRAVRAPATALRIARAVRALDLTAEMRRLRRLGIPTTVVGCTTDTLTTAVSSRRVAALLGAEYRELSLPGGHMWMVGAGRRLAAELDLHTR